MVVREHFKAQFLKGFKKDEKGQVTRVQDFVMPSFTLKNKQVEAISDVITSSSDLFSQLSSIMDQKIANIYKPINDLKDQLDIMKKANIKMIIVLSKLLIHQLRQHLFKNHYIACR